MRPNSSASRKSANWWGGAFGSSTLPTLSQAERLICNAIATYHLEQHRGLGDAPARVWLRGVRQHGIPVIGDDRQLSKMLGVHAERTLSRSGISLFDLQYQDPGIVGPLLEKLASKQPARDKRKGSATARVKIKYNPADISEVYVWDAIDRLYVTLPCVSDVNLNGVSLWLHQKRAEWRAVDGRESTPRLRVAARPGCPARSPGRRRPPRARLECLRRQSSAPTTGGSTTVCCLAASAYECGLRAIDAREIQEVLWPKARLDLQNLPLWPRKLNSAPLSRLGPRLRHASASSPASSLPHQLISRSQLEEALCNCFPHVLVVGHRHASFLNATHPVLHGRGHGFRSFSGARSIGPELLVLLFHVRINVGNFGHDTLLIIINHHTLKAFDRISFR